MNRELSMYAAAFREFARFDAGPVTMSALYMQTAG
jgi:hypothetical protein